MKSSIHLLYGIIIGILICACTGQSISKSEQSPASREFKEEKIVWEYGVHPERVNPTIAKQKAEGWTLLDYEISSEQNTYLLFGK